MPGLLHALTHADEFFPAADGGMVRISSYLWTGAWRAFHSPAGPVPVWREIDRDELVALTRPNFQPVGGA